MRGQDSLFRYCKWRSSSMKTCHVSEMVHSETDQVEEYKFMKKGPKLDIGTRKRKEPSR
jgi:hypothetical protein